MCPFHSPVESYGGKVTPNFVQNTTKIHTPGDIAPTKLIQSYIVIYQNVRVINAEVWPPLYTPFNQLLSLQNFFTSWPLKFNPVLRLRLIPATQYTGLDDSTTHIVRVVGA